MAAEETMFPKFADGDVLIILSSSRTYYLHAGVMRRNSTTFAKLLAESHGAVLSSKARKEGVTTRFRLDLTGATGNLPGRFVRRVRPSIIKPNQTPRLEHDASMLILLWWWIGCGLQWAYSRQCVSP